MQRTYHRLTAARVEKLKPVPGKHPDGDGLYLKVTPALVASWAFRFMINGTAREMGLGPVRHITLSRARQLAAQARDLKREGTDPLTARQAKKLGASVARAKTMSFQQCARAYIHAHRKNMQWSHSLENHAFPVIGSLPVETIDTPLVLQVIEPLWTTATETASRVRGRIENILDWAKTREYRSGENPARWKGHLDNLLPKRSQVAPVQHQPALPYRAIAAFMTDLRAVDASDARALEFAILCASRTGEVLAAKWEEFGDYLADRVWTIPGKRMKMRKEHRVALSAAALAILEQQKAIRVNDYVFPGQGDKAAGRSTLDNVLKRRLPPYYDAEGRKVTVHGFRSTFSDWVADQTSFDRDVREMALAHAVSDKVEAAYRRGDMFAKRLNLAEAWGRYCAGAEVVSFPVEEVRQSA